MNWKDILKEESAEEILANMLKEKLVGKSNSLENITNLVEDLIEPYEVEIEKIKNWSASDIANSRKYKDYGEIKDIQLLYDEKNKYMITVRLTKIEADEWKVLEVYAGL